MNPIQQEYFFGSIKHGEFTAADDINDYLCILNYEGSKIIKIDNLAFPSDDYPALAVIITYELSPIEDDE